MFTDIFTGLMLPFMGTSLGSLCVLFMKKDMGLILKRSLTGFASGVMVAASIWSLLIPALTQTSYMGRTSFIPAASGFWLGILFLLILDSAVPHLHLDTDEPEGPRADIKRTTMLVLAVTIHNIPEGMAVGIVYAGWLAGNPLITLSGALALSIGIAIQNFPEGAIVSMPLCAAGSSKKKAVLLGILSGAVEPVAALITIFLSKILSDVMPYFLAFAAGAMLYVVVEELIPEMSEGRHTNHGVIFFAAGFTLMMALDVALG